jgi:hypothetical protein
VPQHKINPSLQIAGHNIAVRILLLANTNKRYFGERFFAADSTALGGILKINQKLFCKCFGYCRNNPTFTATKSFFMKKFILLFAAAASLSAAKAQLTLTGTGYAENFDNIASGLPTGWTGNTGATASTTGTAATLTPPLAPVAWNITTGAFKNVASATGLTASANAAAQSNAANRAFGLRQTGSFGDPGAAFTLQIANTNGFSSFQLSFRLQSLDSASARSTVWQVQYAVGATPVAFTDAPSVTGNLATGDSTFGSAAITADFGTALDNQSSPVWIRIVALAASTGTNNRATTAIDDFNLTWTTGGAPNYRPTITALSPVNGSVNVPVSTDLAITFDREIAKGTGHMVIKNETDQTEQTIDVATGDVSVAAQVATITNVTLALGKTYHVTFDAAAFDTAGYPSYGIADTGAWRFKTALAPVYGINENFDAACASGGLPAGWTQYSVTGAQTWACNSSTAPNYYLTMNGFAAGANNENEDWLISPLLEPSFYPYKLYYRSRFTFAGEVLHVLYSEDYTGVGDPNNATWTDLNISYSSSDTAWQTKGDIHLFPYNNYVKYCAFKYTSTTTDGSRWDLDSVVLLGEMGLSNISHSAFPITVIGRSGSNQILVDFSMEKAAVLTACVYDITGREVYRQSVRAVSGNNRVALHPNALQSGMYFVRIGDGYRLGNAKAVVY